MTKARKKELVKMSNRFDQYTLCNAVQSLTRQALADGFDAEDIKAVLAFMMETEVDVTVDRWVEGIRELN